MTKEIWINLPVKNIERSKVFYQALGFTYNPGIGNADVSACFVIGSKGFVLMLFEEKLFTSYTRIPISDTSVSSEVLISIDAESRDEVDELTAKAEEAGGSVFGKPTEIQGWMYGSGFSDPDGHRWNVLHMDMSQVRSSKT